MLLLLALLLVPEQLASPLDGEWVSACLPMGKGGRHGTIVKLTIDGKHVTAVAQTYAHATCDVPTIETRLIATSDGVAVKDGSASARLNVDDVLMTPQAADVVTIWNQDRVAKIAAPSIGGSARRNRWRERPAPRACASRRARRSFRDAPLSQATRCAFLLPLAGAMQIAIRR